MYTFTATAALTAPSVRKIILAQTANGSGAPIPLGKFLRWQLAVNGTATGTWDATFRIALCANPIGDGDERHARAMRT